MRPFQGCNRWLPAGSSARRLRIVAAAFAILIHGLRREAPMHLRAPIMIPDSDPLIRVTERGLYCPPGDFYIDPWRPVQTAVITHGHGDHLRPGSARYILARPGERIARIRLCGNPGITPVDYGARIRIGAATVSLHPAGHILGSAQVRIEHAGQIWVVSGDYKRQHDPTCAAFEPLECDVFVSEATFALPIYQW